MAPISREGIPQKPSPVSPPSSLLDKDDFVLLDEESTYAHWDGDQTKYIPPSLHQSLTASARIALDGVINEPLTRDNIMKNSAPLAKDLGAVAKDTAIAAAAAVERAWAKLSATNSAATSAAGPGPGPGPVTASRHGPELMTVTLRSPLAAEASSLPIAAAPTWEPVPHALAPKPKKPRSHLSDQEEVAIANAVLDGRLKTGAKHRDDVRAFLAAFRKEQALIRWKAKADAKPHADNKGTGLKWFAEADDGFDPLGVSGTWKRPAIDVHDEHARKAMREEWVADRGAGDDGSGEMEDVPLEEPTPEDPDVVEDILSGGRLEHAV
ncbi:MAG: hypothetical protein LQ341_000144 [Variospora aurantia]|nr:MAG: hypothetical protein LQ341_000144 [Variospora aurantia]